MPPPAISILSWNCRGMGNLETVTVLRSLVNQYQPSCLFLTETKCEKEKVLTVANSLGFNRAEIVNCRGTVGGMAFLWDDNCGLEVVSVTDRVIILEGKDLGEQGHWILIGCYATPYSQEKEIF